MTGTDSMKLSYPVVKCDTTVVDKLHGREISDHYRWLEDPDSEETKSFVDAQNDVTMPYINQCAVKSKIQSRLTEMWDYPKYGCPFKRGSKYFYFYNSGLQNQSVLYTLDQLDGEARVFFDPNELSSDGTVALNGFSFSEDGSFFAYGISTGGSDWVEVKFKEVSTGKDLSDTLKRVKFSCMAWTHDNKGLFYNIFPKNDGKSDGTETTSNLNQKLMYHSLETLQDQDILCLELPEHPTWMISAEISDCGRYVVITIQEGCEPNNQLYICDLETIRYQITGILPLITIVNTFEAVFEYCINEGPIFTYRTNLNAPLYRLINIDLTKLERTNWTDLIPADENALLEWAACCNQTRLVVCHLKDVKNVLSVHDLKSGEKQTSLSIDMGTIDGFDGRKKNPVAFFRLVSFLTPGIIYECDMTQTDPKLMVFRETTVKGFDLKQFEVHQVFYASKDNVKIPMYIVHPKDIKLDTSNPCLLYGYGGFNISITPSFSVSRILFMQHFKGVYALANIRGGGEYGEKWHNAGRLANKQNCFDDFIAAGDYLLNQKYTTSKKLIVMGGSNGGLLVGTCVNQRPDLFGAAIVQVGVMDMLRFHKFTIGHAWTSDFGDPDKAEAFEWIIKYSPLHNIVVPSDPATQYPAMLLLTADHDDRVVPLHSLKFAAQVQELVGRHPQQTNPLLIRIDVKAGHGAGKPTTKSIQELTDIYSFLQVALGLAWCD